MFLCLYELELDCQWHNSGQVVADIQGVELQVFGVKKHILQ